MSRRGSNGDALGVALTPVSMTAAGAAMPTVWSGDVEVKGGTNGAREALAATLAATLAAALTQAARASGIEAPTLVVALLPPLAETRTISLPPLREDERNAFLARNASRYFVAARGAQVVGSHAPVAAKGTSAGPVLATTTSQMLMHAVHAASASAGCAVRAVVPAESAWAAAAVAIWPALARGSACVIVTRDDRTDLLTLSSGALEAVRRFRGPPDADEIVAVAHGGPDRGATRIAVLGPADATRAMAQALGTAGVRVLVPEPQWSGIASRPEALAARFASAAVGLEFRSEESRAVERARIRRGAWWTLGAGVAMLVVSSLVYYGGVQRELSAVQAERAAIRTQVEASLVGRSSVDATYRQVAGLATAVRTAPRWSAILTDLATFLPNDASLTALRARGDSIFVDGVAERAAPVFDEIARMPGISGVRATAPVRRDAVEGEAPLEHFSLGAQLTAAKAAGAQLTGAKPAGAPSLAAPIARAKR